LDLTGHHLCPGVRLAPLQHRRKYGEWLAVSHKPALREIRRFLNKKCIRRSLFRDEMSGTVLSEESFQKTGALLEGLSSSQPTFEDVRGLWCEPPDFKGRYVHRGGDTASLSVPFALIDDGRYEVP